MRMEISDEDYQLHRQKKAEAQKEKKADIENREKKLVFSMDVQDVMVCPIMKALAVYFKTKLTVHNFGFGSTKKDTCADCLRFTNTLNAIEDAQTKNEIMAERLLHKLRAKRFFKELNLCPEDSRRFDFYQF